VNGNCDLYKAQIACPPQQLLGWDVNGAMWGYFLGASGKCGHSTIPRVAAFGLLLAPAVKCHHANAQHLARLGL
jgi:hypothetical protein